MAIRPSLFAGMGEAFVSAFGGDHEALVTIAAGDVRRVPCIFREFRSGGFAEEQGASVEGVTHTLAIDAEADPGVEQEMPILVVPVGLSAGEAFIAAGVHRDGRAMTRVLLAAA
ncbi:hypothetical protein [Mesorhizobium sp. B2-4-7]|uniref:hypothetical protein n=1 Tax=Mesorhizobium sp. B2-4-7 TaxID=2589942 RepID=UPI00112CE4EF|nr:hypothetical protein [Mesorhizobium sp. B2-4-7]TPL30178.1 hypothetical protein FJ946_02615 [Mesorhizobium sp. B2-4-7]